MIRLRISLCTVFAILFGCSTTLAAPPERKPVLVPVWKRTTIGLPKEDDINADVNKPAVKWLSELYERVRTESRKSGRAQIPPAVPGALANSVVYSNDFSLAALSLKPDPTLDPPLKPGEVLWSCDCDSLNRFRSPWSRETLKNWLKQEEISFAERIQHNTLRGSFILRGKEVLCIDEIPILPVSTELNAKLNEEAVLTHFKRFGGAWELVLGNRLKGLDAESGKVKSASPRGLQKRSSKAPFGANVYLGCPLTIEGRFCLVHEKGKQVRLTRIDLDLMWQVSRTEPGDADQGILSAANKTFDWDTELVVAPTAVVADPHRRIHAIHLVENKGLILCPTHLGRVVAVDSKTGKIQWTHEYAPLDAKRFPTFAPEWVVVPPVVVGDKYIYAPADFPELLCLNVADGKKAWSVKKADGLYPAVVGELVLVIGEKTLRSFSLKDGSERWKLDLPGLPCGRGAMLGDKYLLPISEPKTWKGMIAIVDPKAGKVLEVLKPEKDEPIGNLVVHQEFLISQTLTEIAVFPIRK